MTKVELVVRLFVNEEFHLDGINSFSLAQRLGDPGSLALLYVRLGIEDALHVDIPPETYDRFLTVGDIVNYLEARYRIK